MGCNVDPFAFSHGANGDGGLGDGGGGGDDGGGGVIDGGTPDATPPPDACIPEQETCNGADDDCDGNVDEDFDLDNDPANCGACNRACDLQGADGTCESGDCTYTCRSNFHDLNGDLNTQGSNGCEYGPCTIAGDEVCNGIDDDCNGSIDDNIQGLDSDPDNCGSCFHKCIFVNVDATTCSSGDCGYTTCLDGYADINAVPAGCEYECPVNPPLAQEDCNAVDDDCDGTIDELPISGLGDDCYPANTAGCTDNGDGTFSCTGACQAGTRSCNLGVPSCDGYKTPAAAEQCDSVDHDCDGDAYNGFDIQNDPNHCGTNCEICNLPHALPYCESGQCKIRNTNGCEAGYVDQDGDPANGCEYQCTITGPEVCDGVDNDCDCPGDTNGDGVYCGPGDTNVDEGVTPPSGLDCSLTGTPCEGVQPTCSANCDDVVTWHCDYSGVAEAETNSCGDLLFQETQCDGADNDCDTFFDESFPVGDACPDSGTGACKNSGTYICDSGDPTAVVCDSPLQPGDLDEECNDVDDDCDGNVDEQSNDLVGVDSDGDTVVDYYIFAYEASRPDADASTSGTSSSRACSKPGVLPWRSVTWSEADSACLAAGGHLCDAETEWEPACAGPNGDAYPYGDTYERLSCNGNDFDADCTPPNDHIELLETGYDYDCPATPNTCESAYGVYDMSGNLKEWTATSPSGGFYQVRGGAYDNVAEGLTCQNDFLVFEDATAFPTLGFRCCVDAP